MRSVIPELLWIGNARDARDPRVLTNAGIRAVVDLAMDEPVSVLPRDLVYCRLPLVDGDDDEAGAILQLAVTTVRDSLRLGLPTLVACSAGLSRSPAVAAMAVALWRGREPVDVLREITAGASHDVAPALWARLTSLSFGP